MTFRSDPGVQSDRCRGGVTDRLLQLLVNFGVEPLPSVVAELSQVSVVPVAEMVPSRLLSTQLTGLGVWALSRPSSTQ